MIYNRLNDIKQKKQKNLKTKKNFFVQNAKNVQNSSLKPKFGILEK